MIRDSKLTEADVVYNIATMRIGAYRSESAILGLPPATNSVARENSSKFVNGGRVIGRFRFRSMATHLLSGHQSGSNKYVIKITITFPRSTSVGVKQRVLQLIFQLSG